MKKLLSVIFVLMLVFISSCRETGVQNEISLRLEDSNYPRYWSWHTYQEGQDMDSFLKRLHDSGIRGLLLKAPIEVYPQVIELAKQYDIDIHAWVWTMNDASLLDTHPEWYSVNKNGVSLADDPAYVEYYRFLCPAIDGVRKHVLARMEEYCKVEGLKGICIDYHRYVDVFLPTGLWKNYGIIQDREYPQWDYGYHPAMIEKFEALHGYTPYEIEYACMDAKWAQFRCDQITEIANEISKLVRSHGLLMGASPFPTPALASNMVRQDWGKWELDIVFPMVYYGAYELGMNFINDCIEENVLAKNPQTTLFCGLYTPDFKNNETLGEGMTRAMDAGAHGISLYIYDDLRPEQKLDFERIVREYVW